MTEEEISKQITRYINGELNDLEEDQLWVEFLKNRKYYKLFETELNLADLYRNKNFKIGKSDSQNQVNESKQSYTVWMVSLAAVLLLTVMLYIFSFQNESGLASYALPEIELTQMLGSDIYRDESPDAAQIDQQINRSLSLALNGESQQASQILSSLVSEPLTDDQKIRILYNLGILTYNRGSFEQSLDYFTDVIDLHASAMPDYISQNSQWYIANIYLKKDDVDRAVRRLNRIASGSGFHASDANTLLSTLEKLSID